MPVVGLEHHTGDSTIQLGETPEKTIDSDTTDLHLHNLARTPCVLGGYLVTSGIEPRPSGLESDALTTRLPTASLYVFDTDTVNSQRYRDEILEAYVRFSG
ncbi:hypothetical protein TNCV_1545701 [Trichonephila clavipes]|nr:hypothetical protein TNCV_1545701 [Trichonephila clavipes]